MNLEGLDKIVQCVKFGIPVYLFFVGVHESLLSGECNDFGGMGLDRPGRDKKMTEKGFIKWVMCFGIRINMEEMKK